MQYFKENGKNEVGFLLADKHQRFLQIDTITLGVARHAQSTQNNKFTISLQYLKKNVSDEADLLHAYKHERFLQIDIMIFDRDGQAFSKFPKYQVCNVFIINILKKKLEMKLIFCMQINIKISDKFISTL